MKNKLTLSILTCLLSFGLFAQESPIASGGDASGVGGSSSYSVGQVVYTTNYGTNEFMVQGVQQPYEISVVTTIEQIQEINLSFNVYPNPTTDFLTLSIDNFESSILNFQLFDITGKVLADEQIHNENIKITMKNLPKATYFLKVNENNKTIKTFKTFKIIKQ